MIYVITKGIYSDYHIIAATTNRESAEKMAEHFDADIEEFENATPMVFKTKWYQYLFNLEGVLIKYNVYEIDEYSIGAVSYAAKNCLKWVVNVYTDKSKEVADKIAYDLLAEVRAKEEGI